MNTKNKIQSIRPLIIFMATFYLIDILRLYVEHNTNLHIDRLFTWVLPAILFITFVLKQNSFDYLKLKTGIQKGFFWGIIISIVHIFLYCSFRSLWNHGLTINLNLDFKPAWNVILTVGIVEEIVFRGLVLQNLNSVFDAKTSNIISSILFVLAHIPYWYFGNQLTLPLSSIVFDVFFIFFFGLVSGFVLKKTNSLWPCIIHHSVNNALVLIIR